MKKLQAFRLFVPLATALLFLAGCKTNFHNFTPERIPQNPSGIYTFSFTMDRPSTSLIEESVRAEIIINGESFPMQRVDSPDITFAFDYTMPPGVTEARYYYTVTYDYQNLGNVRTATKYSTQEEGKIFFSRLVNRYAIQLVADRGMVGSKIALVGSGFTPQDVVVIGDLEAQTEVLTPNSIEFTVPPLPASQTFPLILRTASGDLPVSDFRVDAAALTVTPDALNIPAGETEFLIFELPNPAPAGGLYLDIRTDIPTSVIMPEILIPEGARSVNVNITGGQPGTGILQVTAPGLRTVTIPVDVF